MENLRYKYFQLGRKAEEMNHLENAIDHFLKYMEYLDEKDKHIPNLWIYKNYLKLNNFSKAEEFLYKYCEGCSYPYAHTILKNEVSKMNIMSQREMAINFQNKANYYARLNKESAK